MSVQLSEGGTLITDVKDALHQHVNQNLRMMMMIDDDDDDDR